MPMPNTRLELLTGPDALERLGDDWDRLWRVTEPPAPMLESAWVRRWWQVHGRGVEPLVAVLRDAAGAPAAVAPLYRRRAVDRLAAGLRTIQIIGMGEREADEVVGEYQTWLGAPEARDELSDKLADVLAADRRWDRLVLKHLSPESMIVERLVERLRPQAVEVEVKRFPTFVSPALSLDAYIEAITSSKQRHKLRRAMKEANARGLEFVRAGSLEEARTMLGELARLHQDRWVARDKLGVFSGPVFRSFHEDMLPHYARTGRLWMVGLRDKNTKVFNAVRYLLESHGRLYDYISGLDGADNVLNPGLVLHMHTIDAAAKAGVKTYDFMGGDYEYKRRMALEERQQVSVDLFRSNARAYAWLSARGLRRWFRSRRAAVAARTAAASTGADRATPSPTPPDKATPVG
jgi:CelD/BcsL family acetyltransferase involved in cellulose biosynthesis